MSTKFNILDIIGSHNIYEIDYCKPNGEMRTRHIMDACFSVKYGNNYIDASCDESHGVLTFKVDRISGIRCSWIEIHDTSEVAPEDGVYVFACRGDNHHEYEMYKMNKGDKLWKFFEGEYTHMNGWFEVVPIAYHYIGFYPEESAWIPLNDFSISDSLDEYEVVVYQKGDKEFQYALKLYSLWPEDDFLIRESTKERSYDENYWMGTTFLAHHKIYKY